MVKFSIAPRGGERESIVISGSIVIVVQGEDVFIRMKRVLIHGLS
jgi:hypothetical protein